MVKGLLILGCILALMAWPHRPNRMGATELPQSFFTGIQQYKDGDFPAAIKAFTRITDAGVRNADLYYNLGNAYLKNGDLGQAILWYERALRLNPRDPDLKFNHSQASSKTLDEREDQSNPIIRVLLFWKHLLGRSAVTWLAVLANLLFWVVITIDHLRKKRALRTMAGAMALLAVILGTTAIYDYYERVRVRYAVILPDEVAVRSGLTDSSTVLFSLHAGTKVRIERQQGDHYRIAFARGKIGWIESLEVGII